MRRQISLLGWILTLGGAPSLVTACSEPSCAEYLTCPVSPGDDAGSDSGNRGIGGADAGDDDTKADANASGSDSGAVLCAGQPCNNPPPSTCADAATLQTYPTEGTCVDDRCEYEPIETQCPGGCENGACLTDIWLPTTTVNAPTGRYDHTAVWTGSEMIIWGGWWDSSTWYNSGARYNPNTDDWKALSNVDAPTGCTGHTAVWPGSEMIVWGGNGGEGR